MFANKNNLRSELTANIGVLDTSISITSGEGILWENDMVACLEHYENDVCTKREIIKITAKNNDTFTVTRGFAVCIMNDETKQQGQGSQTFVAGDFLSLYLSKEIWESITQNIGINETALQTMVGHINAPRTHINDNCLSWKQSIDSAYNTKYGGLAGFGDASDGDLVITEDTFLDASREYNFNNLTICANATLRFCGLGVPTINVRNNFKNYGTIDMRAPYLQARNTELTDHRLFKNDKVSNKTDDLTQLGTEGGFYKGGSGACGTASGSDASDGHGGNGGSGGAYDGINGGNGGTSGDFGTGGGGGFGMGKGGNGGTGACSGGNGGNGFYGGQGGNVTRRSRFDGGGGAGGKGVIRGGDAGGGVGGCDYNTLGNGGNAITNVYGLHLNARNIWNNLVTAKGGDGGNGGIYYRSGTSGGYAPSGGNGGNGANGGEIMVSYDTMHEQGTFDVSGGKGGTGAKMGSSSESYWRYEQPNGTDGTAGRVVFKNLNNPYIENFTLTNDEDNESILISWKDPTFKPSSTIQWKNTMIRVSTVNYPATITDGTLVVEETTKNQYESTPFSMSATDGVTYYFTAFAIAQDDTMIDVQTNSIEASFGRAIITSFSYDGKYHSKYDASSAGGTFAFSEDGTKLYTASENNVGVHQYALSTPRDISTLSYVQRLSISTNVCNSVYLKEGGSDIFVLRNWNQTATYKYSMSTPYDITTAIEQNNSGTLKTECLGIWFGKSGKYLFLARRADGIIYRYELETPRDLTSTKTLKDSFNTGINGGLQGIIVNKQGTQIFWVNRSSKTIGYCTLGTARDLTTAQTPNSFSVSLQMSDPFGLGMSADGKKLYVAGYNNNIYQYSTLNS